MLATVDRHRTGPTLQEEREALRSYWLGERRDNPPAALIESCPLLPPVAPEEIHELLSEMSSGTRPCTSCCTQCSSNCCNASC